MGALLTKVKKLEKARRWAAKALRPKHTAEQMEAASLALLRLTPVLFSWLCEGGPRPDPHIVSDWICTVWGLSPPAKPGYCYYADEKPVFSFFEREVRVILLYEMLMQRALDRGELPPDQPPDGPFASWIDSILEADPVADRLHNIFCQVYQATRADDPTQRPMVAPLCGTPECDESCPDYWQSMSYQDGGHFAPREWSSHDQGRGWAQAVGVAEVLAVADQARA